MTRAVGVRGEAIAATTLAAAVVRAGAPLVELNLASAPNDPRRAYVRDAALAADSDVERHSALGSPPVRECQAVVRPTPEYYGPFRGVARIGRRRWLSPERDPTASAA